MEGGAGFHLDTAFQIKTVDRVTLNDRGEWGTGPIARQATPRPLKLPFHAATRFFREG